MKHALLFAATALTAACSVGLTTPDGTIITCASDAECPTNYKCEVGVGRCFDTRISVPRVFIDPVARSVGDVAISVTLADNEGDDATLSAEYDVGDGFVAASLDGASELTTSRSGEHHVVTWHAGADIGSNAFRDGVRVRMTARGGGATGPTAESETFAYGDDAPVVTNLRVSGASPLAGNVIIGFDVADTSSDAIAVSRLEVSYDGSFTDTVVIFDAAQAQSSDVLPSGAVVDLQSTPEGTSHAFTWSSSTTSIVDAPDCVLRLTVRDTFAESAPAVSPAFYLRNQLPPRVVSLQSPAAPVRRAAGPTPLGYRLIDENGDPASVIFEYSTDGVHFAPCNEYPVPESEGTVGLATASEGVGGVEHVFVWDPTGVPLRGGAITVRARADTPSDPGQTVAFPQNAGEPDDASYPLTVAVSVGLPEAEVAAFGDLDGDGFIDLLSVSDAGQGLTDVAALGCAETGCMSYIGGIYEATPPGDIVSLATADLDEDGIDESIVVRDSVWIRHDRASSLTLAQNTTGQALTGDFDGDGHADLLLRQSNALAVLYGDGHGSLAAPVVVDVPSLGGLALAHLNGDSGDDLVVSYSGRFARFTSTGDRANPFSITDTTITSKTLFDACDLNHDGISDITVVNGNASVEQYLIDVDGVIRGPYLAGINAASIIGLSCADLDGDGGSDLIYSVYDFTVGKAYVAYNRGVDDTGAPSFKDSILAVTLGSGVSADVIVKGRMDDGSWATATVASGNGIDVIGQGRTTGVFTASIVSPAVVYAASGTHYTEYVIADFDGDGIEDHLFNNGGQNLELWRGSGVRGLSSGAIERASLLSIAASNLATGDANADGKADIWYSGKLAYGQGDGTFATGIATPTMPTGFRRQPMPMTPGFPIAAADFDGDGVYECIPDASYAVQIQQGTYDSSQDPPGIGTLDDAFPATCGTAVNVGTANLQSYNTYFVADLNDDGLADLVESSLRTVTTFAIYFGQIVSHVTRSAVVGAYAAAPDARHPVTAMAVDLVGETVAFHVARASVDDVLVWEDDLVEAGQLAQADGQRPLTTPYELRGDVRLTASSPADSSTPPLHVEQRLGSRVGTGTDFAHAGLDSSTRGLVIDLPVMEGNKASAVTNAANRIFLRATDYDNLTSGKPKRRFSWIEIPRDDDGDLTTGTGMRYVTAARGGGYVVRVLTDRGGVFVGFTP